MNIDWSLFVAPIFSALVPWLVLAVCAGIVVILIERLLRRLFRW